MSGGSSRARAASLLWIVGWPVRFVLLLAIRAYRLTLGQVARGNCRFYPSCSAYAEEAIGELGAVRGTGLAIWRVLRCSPLSAGGVDRPPVRRRRGHDDRTPGPNGIEMGKVAS